MYSHMFLTNSRVFDAFDGSYQKVGSRLAADVKFSCILSVQEFSKSTVEIWNISIPLQSNFS
jgi:hypothetical protein